MDRAHHSQLKELLLHLAELKKRLDESWESGGFGTPSRPSPQITAVSFWSMMI